MQDTYIDQLFKRGIDLIEITTDEEEGPVRWYLELSDPREIYISPALYRAEDIDNLELNMDSLYKTAERINRYIISTDKSEDYKLSLGNKMRYESSILIGRTTERFNKTEETGKISTLSAINNDEEKKALKKKTLHLQITYLKILDERIPAEKKEQNPTLSHIDESFRVRLREWTV